MIGPSGGRLLIAVADLPDKQARALLETTRCGVIAGIAGGLAEIGWVALYSAATGIDPATLARGVTTSAGVSALFPAAPVALGVTIHMSIAVTLGIVLSFVWRALSSHRVKVANPYPSMIAALVGVWAINFFVVLPIISPAFVLLMPYSVSLMSKVLFGVAAAEALRRQDASARKARPKLLMSCATPLYIRWKS
jgi:hypothetical protein